MYQIANKNILAKLSSLFDNGIPNSPILYSVLNGTNPGKMWVDKIDSPSNCLIISSANYSFYVGDLSPETITSLGNIFNKYPLVKLSVTLEQSKKLRNAFDQFNITQRVQFTLKQLRSPQVRHWMNCLPVGCAIRRIDSIELFKQCNWYEIITQFYGTDTSFLNFGIGFCLVDQKGEVLSEAYAGFIGRGLAEIGWATHEHHRGRGLACIVTAYLIDKLFANNLQPVASCDTSNPASSKVALKVGMLEEMKYHFLKWKS